MAYINGISSDFTVDLSTIYNVEVNMEQGNQSLKVDGHTIASGSDTTALNTQKEIFLFGYNLDGTIDTRFPVSLRIYNLKLYDANEMVRNLVPCYRKSDNITGMYDTVNNQFYAKSGSGNFTIGDDYAIIINSTIVKKAYDHTLYAIWKENS